MGDPTALCADGRGPYQLRYGLDHFKTTGLVQGLYERKNRRFSPINAVFLRDLTKIGYEMDINT